jgi:hypothetical protein
MIYMIISFLMVIIVTVLMGQYVLSYIYNYRISKKGIKFVLFGIIPIMRFSFRNILEVSKISPKESMKYFAVFNFENRFWGQRVLIRRGKGIFRIFTITPDNADEFIAEANRYIDGGM